jgi:hypothetical protein
MTEIKDKFLQACKDGSFDTVYKLLPRITVDETRDSVGNTGMHLVLSLQDKETSWSIFLLLAKWDPELLLTPNYANKTPLQMMRPSFRRRWEYIQRFYVIRYASGKFAIFPKWACVRDTFDIRWRQIVQHLRRTTPSQRQAKKCHCSSDSRKTSCSICQCQFGHWKRRGCLRPRQGMMSVLKLGLCETCSTQTLGLLLGKDLEKAAETACLGSTDPVLLCANISMSNTSEETWTLSSKVSWDPSSKDVVSNDVAAPVSEDMMYVIQRSGLDLFRDTPAKKSVRIYSYECESNHTSSL